MIYIPVGKALVAVIEDGQGRELPEGCPKKKTTAKGWMET